MKDFGELMRRVAWSLGYDPTVANRHGQARSRPHGSLCIDFRQGLFMDYAAGAGGGVFDFIRAETGQDPRDWLKRNNIGSHTRPVAKPRTLRRKEDLGAERRSITNDELDR